MLWILFPRWKHIGSSGNWGLGIQVVFGSPQLLAQNLQNRRFVLVRSGGL